MKIWGTLTSLLCMFTCSLTSYPAQVALLQEHLVQEIAQQRTTARKTDGVHEIRGVGQFVATVQNMPIPSVVVLRSQGGEYQEKIDRIFKDLAAQYKERVRFCLMDVAHNKDFIKQIAAKLNLSSVSLPLIMYFKGSLLLPLEQGMIAQADLVRKVEQKFGLKLQAR